MQNEPKRHIGIIGFGQIGASLAKQIQTAADLNIQIDFIYESVKNILGNQEVIRTC